MVSDETNPKPKKGIIGWEATILCACVALSISIHGLSIVDGFGENDSARLAVLAAEWHHTGKIHSYSYPLRTSPLYIHSIKVLLGLGVPLKVIPPLMNWMSVILGSLTLIPLYLLWRLLSKPSVSAVACLFFFVTPAFWLANIYGMSHLPSFTLFVTSLLLFAWGLRRERRARLWLFVGSAVLAILSVGLKADIILCFGAYLGLVLCLGVTHRRHIGLSLLMPVLALGSVILYTRVITSGIPALSDSASTWAKMFPFTLESIKNRNNLLVPMRSVGILLFDAFVLSIVYCIAYRRHLRMLLFSFLWALPLLLFWGLKMGNSARHMMAAFGPLLFLLALVMADLLRRPRVRWATILALLVGNYSIGTKGDSIMNSPAPQLHRLTQIVKKFAGGRHTIAKAFAEIDEVEQKLYAGSTTVPYVEWEAFVHAESVTVYQTEPRIYRLFHEGKPAQLLRIHKIQAPAMLEPSAEWLAFSFERDIWYRQDEKWLGYMKDPRLKLKLEE